MISLNDVLLAMSNIPVDDPIAEIWGRGLQGGYKIIKYTGSLPITINANGDALLDYRIYGADGGVGVATESGEPAGYKLPMVTMSENLFDAQGTDNYGYYDNVTGEYVNDRNYKYWRFHVKAGDVIRWTNAGAGYGCCFLNGVYKRRIYDTSTPYTIPADVDEITNNFSYRAWGSSMVTKNQPLPDQYVPYSRTDTPIYIGENQLDAIGEYRDYVDFGIQKIARKIREYTFTGNETFNLFAQNAYGTCWVNLRLYTTVAYCPIHQTTLRSSHFTAINNSDANFWYGYPQLDDACNFEVEDGYDTVKIFFRSTANFSTAEECKAYFKEQYDNGTPVKIWFVMKYTVGQYESTDNGKEDPPVPFPAIPTVAGTTVIDCDLTDKPSEMYVKYIEGRDGS